MPNGTGKKIKKTPPPKKKKAKVAKRRNGKNGQPTMRDHIEKWLAMNLRLLSGTPHDAHKLFEKRTKKKVAYSHFFKTFKSYKTSRAAKSKSKLTDKKVEAVVNGVMGKMLPTQMVARIAFLEWWNKGERSGYVDQLLKEIEE